MNVEIKQSPIHGFGVFAVAVILHEESQNFYGSVTKTPTDYGFDHEDGWFEPFPPFRYMNHSLDNNCETVACVDGTFEVIALRDIAEGEELTIDYGFDPEGENDSDSKRA